MTKYLQYNYNLNAEKLVEELDTTRIIKYLYSVKSAAQLKLTYLKSCSATTKFTNSLSL